MLPKSQKFGVFSGHSSPMVDIVVTCLQQGQASIATSLCIFFTTHTLFLSSFCMSSYFAQ